MAVFQFDLLLPDGQLVHQDAAAEWWRWWEAFDRACRAAEERLGLPPFSGIRCVAYRHADGDDPAIALAA